jgi:transcriptional regulator with XRE-family HTH domain
MFEITDKEIESLFKTVAKNVQQKRIDKGKTQLEVAQVALDNANDTYLSKLENYSNNKVFNIEQLYRIAKFLDCSIEDFFKGVKYE